MTRATYVTTFDGLKDELGRYVEDDTTEFTSDIDNIVARAQDRVSRDLDLEFFREVRELALTISDPVFTKPADCLLVRSIFIPSVGTYIEERTLDVCKLYGGTGVPRYRAEATFTTLYLAPTPDQDYAVEVNVLVRPTPLAADNQTNWLTEHVPDLLLFAALIESEQYLVDEAGDPRIEGWRKSYGEYLASAKMEFAGHERKDRIVRGAPPPAQPAA